MGRSSIEVPILWRANFASIKNPAIPNARKIQCWLIDNLDDGKSIYNIGLPGTDNMQKNNLEASVTDLIQEFIVDLSDIKK